MLCDVESQCCVMLLEIVGSWLMCLVDVLVDLFG